MITAIQAQPVSTKEGRSGKEGQKDGAEWCAYYSELPRALKGLVPSGT